MCLSPGDFATSLRRDGGEVSSASFCRNTGISSFWQVLTQEYPGASLRPERHRGTVSSLAVANSYCVVIFFGFTDFSGYIRGMKNTKLVYSTGGAPEPHCPRCGEKMEHCRCRGQEAATKKAITAVLRMEKGGRRGKVVTVIDRLPADKAWLKDMTARLKKRCGTGGTFRLGKAEGLIEIQGDKRELIRELLRAAGVNVKG